MVRARVRGLKGSWFVISSVFFLKGESSVIYCGTTCMMVVSSAKYMYVKWVGGGESVYVLMCARVFSFVKQY